MNTEARRLLALAASVLCLAAPAPAEEQGPVELDRSTIRRPGGLQPAPAGNEVAAGGATFDWRVLSETADQAFVRLEIRLFGPGSSWDDAQLLMLSERAPHEPWLRLTPATDGQGGWRVVAEAEIPRWRLKRWHRRLGPSMALELEGEPRRRLRLLPVWNAGSGEAR